MEIESYNIFIYKNKIIYKFSFLSLILNVFLLCYIILREKLLIKNSLPVKLKPKKENDMFELFLKNKTNYYYIKRTNYLKRMNITYNESNLITFQDKLNYLLIHESPEYKSNIVDKIKLSEYSKKILGKDICIPILKIYDNVDEINLNELPQQFVIKCNHGSGWNIFCKDKNQFDLQMAKKHLGRWMSLNYGISGNEFQYFFIKKKILVNPYLGNLIDYKTFCFNGKPKFIAARIVLNSTKHEYIYNYYDTNWNITDIEYGTNSYKRDPNFKIEKPKNLNLLLEYAEKLSEEFVFVRVDFYEINGNLFLGEMTFTPSNNGMPYKNQSQRIYLGNLLNVTKIKPYLFNK